MSGTTWAAAVLAAGLLAGSTGVGAGTAFADSSGSGSGAGAALADGSGAADLSNAARQDCALIKDLGPVVTDLLAIVNGGANTPGSVAWLDAGAAKAKAAGYANLASWLTMRATLRKEQGAVLETRQEMLTTGTSWCQAHGFGAAS